MGGGEEREKGRREGERQRDRDKHQLTDSLLCPDQGMNLQPRYAR